MVGRAGPTLQTRRYTEVGHHIMISRPNPGLPLRDLRGWRGSPRHLPFETRAIRLFALQTLQAGSQCIVDEPTETTRRREVPDARQQIIIYPNGHPDAHVASDLHQLPDSP
jgi:hypothetical protein